MIARTIARRAAIFAAVCLVFATSLSARTRSRSSSQAVNAATIVIDAGHGGFDRGGIPGQRVPEKDMALDVAVRLKLKLQNAGYKVVMTRDTDVFVPLPSRVAIANSLSQRDFYLYSFQFRVAQRGERYRDVLFSSRQREARF